MRSNEKYNDQEIKEIMRTKSITLISQVGKVIGGVTFVNTNLSQALLEWVKGNGYDQREVNLFERVIDNAHIDEVSFLQKFSTYYSLITNENERSLFKKLGPKLYEFRVKIKKDLERDNYYIVIEENSSLDGFQNLIPLLVENSSEILFFHPNFSPEKMEIMNKIILEKSQLQSIEFYLPSANNMKYITKLCEFITSKELRIIWNDKSNEVGAVEDIESLKILLKDCDKNPNSKKISLTASKAICSSLGNFLSSLDLDYAILYKYKALQKIIYDFSKTSRETDDLESYYEKDLLKIPHSSPIFYSPQAGSKIPKGMIYKVKQR